MPLFKKLEEVKKYVAVNASIYLEDIMPFIRRAENLQIRPALGRELYNELHTAYEADADLSEPMKALLEVCQDCLANFAYLLYIPHGATQISASGIQQVQNATNKPATPEQIQRLESSYATTAYRALDDLLEYLEENAKDYPQYDQLESRRYFLHSTRQFAQYVNIGGSRRTYIALQPVMARIEQGLLLEHLGPKLFQELKNWHQATTQETTTEAPDLALLLEKVKPVVAFHTIAKGIVELSLAITETGLHIYSSSSTFALTLTLPADEKRINRLLLQYQGEAEKAEKELTNFLYARIDKYPLFKESGAFVEPQAQQDPNAAGEKFFMA
ncbi:hypothetical protein EFA69_16245 [Rufibacter immobilis]|uniref:Uncharacterized protein n=1 Tax=Rufibacter immobilis TaxID=1348778 RepID=A0A3M9MSH6_9BACT|nr:DUF6712 family protein [Rufibacter immobilis]RNI27668.1 hypothetical protein EFA69_16245 [Rufibacter immobilis]